MRQNAKHRNTKETRSDPGTSRKASANKRHVPTPGHAPGKMAWQVYIIRCSDHSLYTGITTDVERRFLQHLEGTGARYFRGRQPRQVVYLETGHTRSSATRRELEIKAMTRARKRLLIASRSNAASSLPVP